MFYRSSRFTNVYVQVDLKNCNVLIRDGYNKTGAVNNSGGYAAAATTMTVDGIDVSIPDGMYFAITALPLTRYKITSASDTSGVTTSITFTPGLEYSVPNNEPLIFTRQIEMKVGDGDLSYTQKKARKYTLDRGELDEVKNDDQAPLEIKLDFTYEFLKADSGGIETVEDVLEQSGEASDWVSTDSDQCRPYCVDLILVNNPACADGTKAEVTVFPQFRYEQLDHSIKNGTVSMTGKCNVTKPTISRVSATTTTTP